MMRSLLPEHEAKSPGWRVICASFSPKSGGGWGILGGGRGGEGGPATFPVLNHQNVVATVKRKVFRGSRSRKSGE